MGDGFHYVEGVLHAEQVPIAAIAARFGTPTYVYSRAVIESRYRAFGEALGERPHLICYAVKANSNLAVLDVLARLGSGFDIVSVGELERVLVAGGNAERVVFSGVGKRRDEMERALASGVRCFNVESAGELDVLAQVARDLGRRAPVSFRVNPNVDARTHPYISTGLRRAKFGVPIEEAPELYRRAAGMAALEVVGVDCHIGSQLVSPDPLLDALDRIVALIDVLADDGIRLRHLDMGGGIGIAYRDEKPPEPRAFVAAIARRVAGRDLELLLEPGRVIVGEAGALLARVIGTKRGAERRFVVVDAAMNDLIRPALYQGWHPVWPERAADAGGGRPAVDVVGPVCESADFLALERPLAAAPGDLLAIGASGAYGFVMSSNYNSRPRAAEVMVDGDRVHLVRERETVADLYRGEHRLPEG